MGKDVITFTGYTWEQILEMMGRDEGVKSLIYQTDILIDGPYIQEQRDLKLAFRGSANQRVIDVAASLKEGKIVLMNWDSEAAI